MTDKSPTLAENDTCMIWHDPNGDYLHIGVNGMVTLTLGRCEADDLLQSLRVAMNALDAEYEPPEEHFEQMRRNDLASYGAKIDALKISDATRAKLRAEVANLEGEVDYADFAFGMHILFKVAEAFAVE